MFAARRRSTVALGVTVAHGGESAATGSRLTKNVTSSSTFSHEFRAKGRTSLTTTTAMKEGISGGSTASYLIPMVGAVAGIAMATTYPRPVLCASATKPIPREKEIEEMQKTFLKYASLKKGDEWLMTPEDFIHSMLPERKEISPKDVDRIKMFFKMADTDNSGALDFAEYTTFFALLSKPEAEFEIAFQLFDLNGDGFIEQQEFEQVIGSASEYGTCMKVGGTAFVSHFFGEDGSKKLSFKEFKHLLQELKDEILRLEFNYYDRQGKGIISGEEFMKLIAHHSEYKHIPQWLQKNLASTANSQVSFSQFVAINHIIKEIKQIEIAIRMYTATGGHIGKEKFKRAVEVSTGHPVLDSEIDLIFSIFDRSGTGELGTESFLYLMNNRSKRKITTPTPTMSIPQTFLMGGAAAMVGASCVYPMDKVKTRLQSAVSVGGSVRANVLNQFKDIGSTFANIFRKEGFFGLYKGMAPQMVGIIPEKAIKITVNDFLKRTIRGMKPAEEQGNELTIGEEAVAGIGTGLFQVLATNPYEIVKIRMQLQTIEGPKKGGLTIIRELGIRGLYTGLPATLLRDVPFNAIYFSSYAGFKKLLKNENGNLSGWDLFCAGIGAGFLGAALDTPADCLKTRLQNGQGKYKGLVDAASTMWKEEGASAFLKGLAPRILIIAPLFSITFMVFEKLQRSFAPHSKPPLQSLAEEFDLVRDSRLKHITSKLDREFGLKVARENPHL